MALSLVPATKELDNFEPREVQEMHLKLLRLEAPQRQVYRLTDL
jgi:hypothetical protein